MAKTFSISNFYGSANPSLDPNISKLENIPKNYYGRSGKDEFLYRSPTGTLKDLLKGRRLGGSFENMRDTDKASKNRNFSALNLPPLQKQNIINQSYTKNNLPIPNSGYSSLAPSNQQMMEMANVRGQASQGNVRQDGTPPNLKNNLLNYIASPHGKGMAQGLLEASGYSEVPVTFGQALAMGMKRGNEYEATAAASQLAKDEFAYKQKQDRSLNWLELQKILSKDNSTTLEKKMQLLYPNLAAGTPEYEAAALALIKSGAMNFAGDKKTGWDEIEIAAAKNLGSLTTTYQSGSDSAFNNNNKLSTLRRSIVSIPADQFGKLAEAKLWVGSLLQSIGIPIDQQSQAMKEAAYALGGEFVMGQIQLTKGAVSEKEMAYFDAISPNITKTKEGMLLMIKLAEHTNNFEVQKNKKYIEFKESWDARKDKGESATDLETAWQKELQKMQSEQKLPKGIIKDMENITLRGALKEWNENNDTAPILNPNTDKSYIAGEISSMTNNEGELMFKEDSQQFIGFLPDGRPKYLVEDFAGNFQTIAVNKGKDE